MGRTAQIENRAVTLTEVAEKTGVSRFTLSNMANHDGYVTSTDKLELLCAYFACKIEDLVEYVPDAASKKEASATKKKALGKKRP
jgi:putative transcriptional regulator